MKIAFLWSGMSSYFNQSLIELAKTKIDFFLVSTSSSREAPFADDSFKWIPSDKWIIWDDKKTNSKEISLLILNSLESFNPDVLIISSWHRKAYRYIARKMKNKTLRVLCMDNQWHGTAKQILGVLSREFYIQSIYDAAFVAGERQRSFAHLLGFSHEDILEGLYTCNPDLYERKKQKDKLSHSFLYVGRLAKEKSIDLLLAAYKEYTEMHPNPWGLTICGTGPLASKVEGEHGINYLGFVQPNNLPNIFADHSVFILPSSFEPWGVVVHEAVSSGLPVICTHNCGSSVHLVKQGFNGYLFDSGNKDQLVSSMILISNHESSALDRMNKNSISLSRQYTPTLWVENLINFLNYQFKKRTYLKHL